MSKFRGLYPPLITPFDEEGRLEEKALRDHVDFVIENGTDGFCAGGSTGEFMNLTREEWERVLQICKEQNRGRVPMLAGGADLATAAAVERCRFAEGLGYDGLLIISPWYQVHTMREVYAHFKAIRDAVPLPIMIYNNPPVTGFDLSYDVLTRMARDGIIQYIKDANSDPFMLARLRMAVGDQLEIFYGHDNNALGGFAFGATGWVSGTANFDPKRWSRLVHLCIDDNDYVQARKLWYEILPFVELVTVPRGGVRADWVAVIKRGRELRGRRVGVPRPPMLPVTEEVDRLVQDVVSRMTF